MSNIVLILLREHYPGKNSMQCCRKGSRKHCIGKILCNVVLILLGHHSIRNTLCNVVPESPNNIAQKEIQAMLSKKHMVNAFT